MGPSGRFTHVIVILMFGTGYMQVLYLGRAPHTKETLPDFCEKCRVTRHSRVFRRFTGSQWTLGFGASHFGCLNHIVQEIHLPPPPPHGFQKLFHRRGHSIIEMINQHPSIKAMVRASTDGL